MAIAWLTALKVIPWGDVIEHAPKVLSAARKLLDRTPAALPPSKDEVQERMAKTLTDLAEQNTRLVNAVEVLRLRTRILMVATVLLGLAVLGLWLR
ncbi:MAG: hypothetical protein RJB34_933 [Pseudomonadota bacterium]|jgi:hypothetical protein